MEKQSLNQHGKYFEGIAKSQTPVLRSELRHKKLKKQEGFMLDKSELIGAYCTLSDLSPKDVNFAKHKLVSQGVAHLFAFDDGTGVTGFFNGKIFVNFTKYALQILNCGSWLKFGITENGDMLLLDARFCKVSFCPTCQWRRSLKWKARFLSLIPEIQKKYPTHKWVFLTLTVPNCDVDDLKGTLRHLNDSFNRLSKLKNFPMVGLVKSVEVTRAWECWYEGTYLGDHGTKWIKKWEREHNDVLTIEPSTKVHPHLHICGLVSSSYFGGDYYVTQPEWREMWKRSLRADYLPVVNIKAVKPKTKKLILPTPEEFAANPLSDGTGMIEAICETLKYTVKEQDLIGQFCQDESVNSSWIKDITEQLYKSRKVEYRGVLKELEKELDAAYESDNLIDITNEEKIPQSEIKELEFRWEKTLNEYILAV